MGKRFQKLIDLRNRLCEKYPIFNYFSCTQNGESEIKLDIDDNSFTCKEFWGDKLRIIRTSRHNFSESYNVKFDEEGKRIYALFVSDKRIILNHKDCLLNIIIKKDSVGIEVKSYNKDNSSHEEG